MDKCLLKTGGLLIQAAFITGSTVLSTYLAIADKSPSYPYNLPRAKTRK